MTYAEISDVQARILRTLSVREQAICSALLEDAAAVIDACNEDANEEAKKLVSCRMVIRALGDGESSGVPIGATQGSMSGLGYAQSWTIGNNGASGELYLTKLEKSLLGRGNRIGSRSPVEDLVPEVES